MPALAKQLGGLLVAKKVPDGNPPNPVVSRITEDYPTLRSLRVDRQPCHGCRSLFPVEIDHV